MIFTDTARIRMTVRFWISMPDGPDAIDIFLRQLQKSKRAHWLILIVNKQRHMKL